MAKKVRQLAAASKRFTIEALVSDISKMCLEEPFVQELQIRLEKPGAVEQARSVGVEIERYKEEPKIASE